jgi:hypothetical protein
MRFDTNFASLGPTVAIAIGDVVFKPEKNWINSI